MQTDIQKNLFRNMKLSGLGEATYFASFLPSFHPPFRILPFLPTPLLFYFHIHFNFGKKCYVNQLRAM